MHAEHLINTMNRQNIEMANLPTGRQAVSSMLNAGYFLN
jgi:hypothetical protein